MEPLLNHHRFGDPLPQEIAIVRSLPGLGDWLCFVPALRSLRQSLPDAEITLIGLNQSVTQRFHHYFNHWLAFPGFPNIPEVSFCPDRTITFLAAAQSLRFDLALQMHGNGTIMNQFVQLLGAKQNAGFYLSGQTCPDRDRFLPYVDRQPEVLRHLHLLEFLRLAQGSPVLEFPVLPEDQQTLSAIATGLSLSLSSPYVCLHPGASIPARRWPTHHFITMANALAMQGYQIVLTGTIAEIDLTETIATATQTPVFNLVGKTNLGTLAALLQHAQLLICNDTGISHLADAVNCKSVVIFSDSHPQRWAPLNRHQHRVVHRWDESSEDATLDRVLAEAIDLLSEQAAAYAS